MHREKLTLYGQPRPHVEVQSAAVLISIDPDRRAKVTDPSRPAKTTWPQRNASTPLVPVPAAPVWLLAEANAKVVFGHPPSWINLRSHTRRLCQSRFQRATAANPE